MNSIEINNATVCITEQTVYELMGVIEKAKIPFQSLVMKDCTFDKSPMPEDEMTPAQFAREQRMRGTITIESAYSNIKFQIELEARPHTQESLGYKLI